MHSLQEVPLDVTAKKEHACGGNTAGWLLLHSLWPSWSTRKDHASSAALAEPRTGSYTYIQVLGAERKLRSEVLIPPENALLMSLEAASCIGS